MNGTITFRETPFIVEKYCLVFPPTYCKGYPMPDGDRSDLDIFREQFCPKLKMFTCVEEFARRCTPTFKKYQDYITMFVVKGSRYKSKDLCTRGPYKKVHLDHAECLRFAKSVYEDMCPINDEQFLNDLALGNYNFDKYLYCVQQIVLALCGEETESFLLDYLLAMNSTFGYNQVVPEFVPPYKYTKYVP